MIVMMHACSLTHDTGLFAFTQVHSHIHSCTLSLMHTHVHKCTLTQMHTHTRIHCHISCYLVLTYTLISHCCLLGFIGSTIDERQLKLSKMARVSSISCNGHIYALLHDKVSKHIKWSVAKLSDQHSIFMYILYTF